MSNVLSIKLKDIGHLGDRVDHIGDKVDRIGNKVDCDKLSNSTLSPVSTVYQA